MRRAVLCLPYSYVDARRLVYIHAPRTYEVYKERPTKTKPKKQNTVTEYDVVQVGALRGHTGAIGARRGRTERQK